MIHSVAEYKMAGCLFLVGESKKSPDLFVGLHERTNGDVCNTGCADISTCKAYRTLSSKPVEPAKDKKVPLPTNAQIAYKMGVSKRQVSKMRKKGILREEILKKGLGNEFGSLLLV